MAGPLLDYPLGKPEVVPLPARVPVPPLPPMTEKSNSQMGLSVNFLRSVVAVLQKDGALDIVISYGMVSWGSKLFSGTLATSEPGRIEAGVEI